MSLSVIPTAHQRRVRGGGGWGGVVYDVGRVRGGVGWEVATAVTPSLAPVLAPAVSTALAPALAPALVVALATTLFEVLGLRCFTQASFRLP